MWGNATASTTGSVTTFNYGNGCGVGTSCTSPSTNFNLPDCRGVTLAGRDNMGGTPKALLTSTYFGTNPDALGALGGSQSLTLTQAMLPNVNFNVNIPAGQGSHSHGLSNGGSVYNSTNPTALVQQYGSGVGVPLAQAAISAATLPALYGTAASGGSGIAFTIVQPTLTANCMIRVLAKFEGAPHDKMVANDNGDLVAIVYRRRFVAA